MAAQVTCQVNCNPAGSLTAAALSALVSSAPIDLNTLALLGLAAPVSDVTSIVGGQVQRVIVIAFTPAFKVEFPDASDQRAPFWGYMRGACEAAAKSPCVDLVPVLA
jgi:hypothetical protein